MTTVTLRCADLMWAIWPSCEGLAMRMTIYCQEAGFGAA
jgi:hypothetical protein